MQLGSQLVSLRIPAASYQKALYNIYNEYVIYIIYNIYIYIYSCHNTGTSWNIHVVRRKLSIHSLFPPKRFIDANLQDRNARCTMLFKSAECLVRKTQWEQMGTRSYKNPPMISENCNLGASPQDLGCLSLGFREFLTQTPQVIDTWRCSISRNG